MQDGIVANPSQGARARELGLVRNIAVDLVLTLITCGLFNLWVQHKQMLALNLMLNEERYNFWMWLLLSIVTLGLYHIYHEFRKSEDLARIFRQPPTQDGILTVVLVVFVLGWVADAIQQSKINTYFGSNQL